MSLPKGICKSFLFIGGYETNHMFKTVIVREEAMSIAL